jgi:hypothetical protein
MDTQLNSVFFRKRLKFLWREEICPPYTLEPYQWGKQSKGHYLGCDFLGVVLGLVA